MPVKRPTPGELEPIETREPRRARARCSSTRLQWSLAHAYDNVPHYRRKFDAAGCIRGDLKSLADLAKFPFTIKADLRDNYPFGMFAVPREQVVAHPRVVGNDRQADGRRLHGARTSTRGPP